MVNISTSQTVEAKGGGEGRGAMPQLPPGSPFEEFFDDFFKNRRGGGPRAVDKSGDLQPRKTNSLGSGFIVDTSGIVVTNNHVIADADEINVIMNDGTKIKAELVGVDKKTDLAVLKFKPVKPLIAVKFGDSDKLRLGEWVIAIGNPFSLGGTVTAGIVSARNRDISSGPYDNYIQTDAAINRGNSGGPLFNLDGEVVGVNTLIISPSGGSIGIGFAVPSKTVAGVVDQLRQFGELRRGWLGVRIQQVTDEIAESLNIKPARGALVAGVDDKGPAKPAGIEPGDVVVKFDGKDIKEPKDLSRVVADTAVGKEVDVVIIRKGAGGNPEGHARPPRGYRQGAAGLGQGQGRAGREAGDAKGARPRSRHAEQGPAQQLQDQGQRQGRHHHRCRRHFGCRRKAALSAGDVIVEVAQEAVSQRRRHQEARRPAEEGRQEIGAAAGLQRRRRTALRRAERAVGEVEAATDIERTVPRPFAETTSEHDWIARIRGDDETYPHKLVAPIALRIQQRGEIAVVDPRGGRGRDRGLGVIGDAEAGLPGSCRDRWRRRRPPACRCRRDRRIRAVRSGSRVWSARPRIGSATSPVSLPSSTISSLARFS